MPNYCYQHMYCYGTAEDIDALTQQILKTDAEGNPCFDFNQVIPMPDALAIACVAPEGSSLKAIHAHNKQQYGYESWYDWCIAHWGTKWNALHTQILDTPADLCIAFDTAWNPAIPIYRQLCKTYPNVQFKIDYMEIGDGLTGSCYSQYCELINDEFTGHINDFAWDKFGWDLVNESFEHDEGYDENGNELPEENEDYMR